KRSMWLGPPTMNMKMTAFALASKWGGFAARGLAEAFGPAAPAAWPSRCSSQDRARAPKPPPAWKRKSRRLWAKGQWEGLAGWMLFIIRRGRAQHKGGVAARWRVGSDGPLHGLLHGHAEVGGTFRHGNAGPPQRGDLFLGGAAAAADDGTGVAHALA